MPERTPTGAVFPPTPSHASEPPSPPTYRVPAPNRCATPLRGDSPRSGPGITEEAPSHIKSHSRDDPGAAPHQRPEPKKQKSPGEPGLRGTAFVVGVLDPKPSGDSRVTLQVTLRCAKGAIYAPWRD